MELTLGIGFYLTVWRTLLEELDPRRTRSPRGASVILRLSTMSEHTSSTSPADPAVHQPLNFRGQRLKKFLRPNGWRVHIASTPEEHRRLKTTLPDLEPDNKWDVHIHGSPEHVGST